MEASRLPCLGRRPVAVALSPKPQRIGRRPLRRPALAALTGLIVGFSIQNATHAAERLRVELNDGLLTIEANDVAVQDLLEEIAGRAGLALSLPNSLPRRVTVEFDELALPVAIDRVLHGMSYALQYAPGSSANKLWVFTNGAANAETSGELRVESESTPPEPPQDGNLLDDGAAMRLEAVAALADQETDPFAFALASAVVDESPAVRYEAIHALGEIGGGVSTRLLQQALFDADPDVRTAAVDALGQITGEQSANALAGVLSDPDPALREKAVYALGEIGGETAAELLRTASADPDEWVREAATDMLRELVD